MMLPDAIDHYPRGERIFRVGDRFRQFQPTAAVLERPPFVAAHPVAEERLWMRITFGDGPAPQSINGHADGRGPIGGYKFGETEDYLLLPAAPPLTPETRTATAAADNGGSLMVPTIGYYSGN